MNADDRLEALIASLSDDRPVDLRDDATDDSTLRAVRELQRIAKFNRDLQRAPAARSSPGRGRAHDLARVDQRSMLEPGRFLGGRYRVERLLGQGGMGEVYAARDEELGIPVALKTLRLDVGREPQALLRLKREVLLARSVSHRNVCRVYDVGRHGDGVDAVWFLTMELLNGTTLRERLHRGGRLSMQQALPLAEQLAAGLAAAHREGVVHRDFKTENVMLVTGPEGERAVIMDFGVARASVAETASDTALAGILGTPVYMAPEQIRGEAAGPRSDIYSLGIVLFEMVTGRLPLEGQSILEMSANRLSEEPPSPRRVIRDLDERWEAAILRCLALDPEARFARAIEVADALSGGIAADAQDVPGVAVRGRALPTERDAFVGRESDLDALDRHLDDGARLVTLLGPGGIGKTRLSIRHGWRSLDRCLGGVWFCDLTDARSIDGIAAAVAKPLGLSLGKADPVQQLGHAIAARGRCLVILDNFEQVVAHAGATLERWMERAPDARFLVTSRERVNLRSEVTLTVGPLEPEAGASMFVERARRLRPGFDPQGKEREAVVEAVRLVEGIPLAIELAAARIRVMTAVDLVKRMRDRFKVLAGGPPGRHATLDAAFQGSWELLDPWERAALAQCSVFEGGFTLEAAEEVLDLSAWPEAPWMVDVVQSLVDRSLLRMWVPASADDETPSARFGMYVSLQEFARAKLEGENAIPAHGSGARALRAAEERHGRFYARYGGDVSIDTHARGEGPPLAPELENLMAACRRALARQDGATAVATYQAAWTVLDLKGPIRVAVELGTAVLGIPLADPDRARALTTMGLAESMSGRKSDALRRYESALEICRAIGERRGEAVVLGRMGLLHREQGRMEESRACYEAALPLHREIGDRRLEGLHLDHLGLLNLDSSRMDEARTYFEAALEIYRAVHNRRGESIVFGHLGNLNAHLGRMEEGRAHYEAALAIHRDLRDRHFEGVVLTNLGILNTQEGRLEDAVPCFEASLVIHHEVGNRRAEGIALANLASLVFEQGRLEESRAECEAALVILREVGERRWEGMVLGNLGSLYLKQDKLEDAAVALAGGEKLLRAVGSRIELAKLLCNRGEMERRRDDPDAARATLADAEELAGTVGVGQDSELEHHVARLRKSLGIPS